MASLYVVEYARQPTDSFEKGVPCGMEPALAVQKLAIGSGSVQSAAFNALTRFVKLHADAICSVAFGSNPTATASYDRLPADGTCYYGVKAGDKVAVITNS